MKVGLTGASGFIARYVISALRERGHEAVSFARSTRGPVAGCVESRPLPADRPPDVAGLDAVINLAGESILGLWTATKRQRIRKSRVATTQRLARALRETPAGPRVLLNASAVGYYGNRGDEALDENSAAGTGFLADVCRDWEAAAFGAATPDCRVACVRIGFVLGRDGGAFPLLRRAFRLGLGGRLGSGAQWMPPVHVEDIAGLFVHLLEKADAAGAFNAACPSPLINAEFTRATARALRRPALLPVPGFLLRTGLGDLSHLLLDSARVLPRRTLQSGFTFRFPTLEEMLRDLCA